MEIWYIMVDHNAEKKSEVKLRPVQFLITNFCYFYNMYVLSRKVCNFWKLIPKTQYAILNFFFCSLKVVSYNI